MRFALAVLGAAVLSGQATSLAPTEAKDHVGQQATVCGMVDDARHVKGPRTSRTFLNFGGRYPKHVFTAMIPASARVKFDVGPEITYLKKRTCVTGEITLYEGRPEIVVDDPKQLKLETTGGR